jgi:hypothetical protein
LPDQGTAADKRHTESQAFLFGKANDLDLKTQASSV